MYRVELKVFLDLFYITKHAWFLMYRVELKALKPAPLNLTMIVPNAPCGVERLTNSQKYGII